MDQTKNIVFDAPIFDLNEYLVSLSGLRVTSCSPKSSENGVLNTPCSDGSRPQDRYSCTPESHITWKIWNLVALSIDSKKMLLLEA